MVVGGCTFKDGYIGARGEECVLDAVEFARVRLGFEPDEKQAEVLRWESKRVLLACTRQWGKSTTAAVKVVHRAYARPGCLVLVASPGERQTGEFMRKVEDLVRMLGVRVRGDGDNEMSVLMPNGSRIVGLPGVHKKVRGFSAASMVLFDEAGQVEDAVQVAASDAGDDGGGHLDDEHAVGEAGVLLRGVGERRGAVVADGGDGAGLCADR